MAPLVTHLVVGERVFVRLRKLDPQVYGPFLLGCLLVDVNHFSSFDRCRTHFIRGGDDDGGDAPGGGCADFLAQLPDLLLRPWPALFEHERAFVAGYLCHLAMDEAWKRLIWKTLHALGIRLVADLPVPGDVLMTAFGVLSSEMFLDFPAVVSALNDVEIPGVLAHVSQEALRAMWVAVKGPMMNGRSPEAYFEMLQRKGRASAEIEVVRHEHELHWEDAVALIQDMGGVGRYIQAGVRRSMDTVPCLWA